MNYRYWFLGSAAQFFCLRHQGHQDVIIPSVVRAFRDVSMNMVKELERPPGIPVKTTDQKGPDYSFPVCLSLQRSASGMLWEPESCKGPVGYGKPSVLNSDLCTWGQVPGILFYWWFILFNHLLSTYFCFMLSHLEDSGDISANSGSYLLRFRQAK